MSFAAETKKQICGCTETDREVLLSELYGMLLFAKKFTISEIVFTTENNYVSKRYCDLLTNIFGVIIEKRASLKPRKSSGTLSTITVVDSEDCKKIYEFFGNDEKTVTLRINRAILENDESVIAFIRGVFLSCGSVTNPEKGYHLEFSIPHKNLCNDLKTQFEHISVLNVNPKIVTRNFQYVLYVKDSEQIADILTYLGAYNSSMTVTGTKVIKEIRNNMNRKVNSEIANIEKVASASAKHIKAIRYLMKTGKFINLSPEIREVCELRLKEPELSLRDLGTRLDNPISRSGVNHRLQKMMEYYEDIRE